MMFSDSTFCNRRLQCLSALLLLAVSCAEVGIIHPVYTACCHTVINWHYLKCGRPAGRRRHRRPVSRAEVTGRLSLPDATSAHAREIVGSFGPQ